MTLKETLASLPRPDVAEGREGQWRDRPEQHRYWVDYSGGQRPHWQQHEAVARAEWEHTPEAHGRNWQAAGWWEHAEQQSADGTNASVRDSQKSDAWWSDRERGSRSTWGAPAASSQHDAGSHVGAQVQTREQLARVIDVWSVSQPSQQSQVRDYDGKDEDYERKVSIYEANSRVAKARRGGKLLERLSGDAFRKVETLDPSELRCDEGVQMLLAFLRDKYEPLRPLKVGSLMSEFVDNLRRNRGEEIRDWNSRFESRLREVEEYTGSMNPNVVAFYYLKKLSVPASVESQIVTGASNKYEYDALSRSALACLPRVSMLRGGSGDSPKPQGGHGGGGQRPGFKGRPGKKVFETENDADADDIFVAAIEEAEATEQQLALSDEDDLPEELRDALAESATWLTQAKKQRAQLEAARSFFKKPSGGPSNGGSNETKSARIAALKARLPCAKCGALGHWYRECTAGQGERGEAVWSCAAATCHRNIADCVTIILDTACAKTVAGRDWQASVNRSFVPVGK
eukprot:6458882-Amphidinium_carterae.1